MVNSTSNTDSRLSKLFAYLNVWIFGAGKRGSDNQGWTVLQSGVSLTCFRHGGC